MERDAFVYMDFPAGPSWWDGCGPVYARAERVRASNTMPDGSRAPIGSRLSQPLSSRQVHIIPARTGRCLARSAIPRPTVGAAF